MNVIYGKTITTVSLVLGALIYGAAVVKAAPGSTGASFLRFSPSPRGSGMGEAQISVTEDAYSAYWNPAGLAALETPALSATHNASFEGVSTQYIGAAYPLRYGSTLGFSATRLSVTPFRGYDSLGVPTDMVDASGMSAGVSYGRALLMDEVARPVLSAGGGLKYIGARLDDASASALAADLGAIYYLRPDNYWISRIPAQELRLALSLRNLGTPLKFDSGSTPLPTALAFGGSWHSHPGGNSELVLALDNVFQSGDGYYAALGAEFFPFHVMAFRAGYRTGQEIGTGLRAGIGFRFSFGDLDYSMSPFGELGAMHKFGLSLRFGTQKAANPLAGETSRVGSAKLIAPKNKIEKLDLFARDFLALAATELAARRYLSALQNLRRAFNLEPGLRDGVWGAKERRLQALVKGLRLVEVEDKQGLFSLPGQQAETAAAAAREYVEGNELKAFLLAHAAWGTDMRGPSVFEELLSLLGELTRMSVRRGEILAMDALKNKKIVMAEKAFKRRDFQEAARESEELLLLDPENALVWKRLGSAYFAMGDNEEAKRAYRKALQLDPRDASLVRFMRLQGWE